MADHKRNHILGFDDVLSTAAEVPPHEKPVIRFWASWRYSGAELPAGRDLTHVLDSAAGLHRYEAEGAFLPSIGRRGRLVPPFGREVESPAL
jgi:hypothetical protein